jgi:hypothetical protein
MHSRPPKHLPERQTIIWLLVEMAVYAVFVFLYFLLVWHFLRDWFKELFEGHRTVYAFAALGFMIVQAALLELVTTGLFRLIRGKLK